MFDHHIASSGYRSDTNSRKGNTCDLKIAVADDRIDISGDRTDTYGSLTHEIEFVHAFSDRYMATKSASDRNTLIGIDRDLDPAVLVENEIAMIGIHIITDTECLRSGTAHGKISRTFKCERG